MMILHSACEPFTKRRVLLFITEIANIMKCISRVYIDVTALSFCQWSLRFFKLLFVFDVTRISVFAVVHHGVF